MILKFFLFFLFFTKSIYALDISDPYLNYSQVKEQLKLLQEQFPTKIKVTTFGQTTQNRLLYMAQVGQLNPNTSTLKILIEANIHGDEKTFLNSTMILLEKLLNSPLSSLLNNVAIVIVPNLNPDGLESTPSKRTNGQNLDMNRDFMKVESPEITAFLKNIVNDFNPHVWFDGHNGGYYPYNVLYLSPSHKEADTGLKNFSENILFPHLKEQLKDLGLNSFYYGWPYKTHYEIGHYWSRIARNYGGISNRLTILLESPGWQEKDQGIYSAVSTLEILLKKVIKEKDQIIRLVNESKEKSLNYSGKASVSMKYVNPLEKQYYFYSPKKDENGIPYPLPDRPIYEIFGFVKNKIKSLKNRDIPKAYVIPKELGQKMESFFALHKIHYSIINSQYSTKIQRYIIQKYLEVNSKGPSIRFSIEKIKTIQEEKELFIGDYLIEMNQIASKVIFQLLEPEGGESLFRWNRFLNISRVENTVFHYPILKILPN